MRKSVVFPAALLSLLLSLSTQANAKEIALGNGSLSNDPILVLSQQRSDVITIVPSSQLNTADLINIQEKFPEQQKDIGNMKSKLEDIERERDELKRDNENLSRKVDDMQRSIDGLERSLNELSSKVNK
ncbi:hypothetical protein [Enterobacter sp. Bisph1]|uniref:hypothetical protein n=1 Tax=Enterobacter sp. Bisph1 TaxID=1274399 RepID=UPI00057C330A|nr:hypothetical protein [Enterobacter sp. Bisph1]